MNIERFEILADAYGGAIARWPADCRDAAFGLMAAAPEATARLLAAAQALDADLDAAQRLVPSPALRQTILAAAPRPRRGAIRRWLVGAGLGVGLAGATAAGLLIGINLTAQGPGEDALMAANIYGGSLLPEDTGAAS